MPGLAVKHFDVLNYVKKAKEFGATEEFAEFNARQIEEAISIAVTTIESKELATKNDIATLQKELVAVELRLIKWILSTGVATVLALVGLLKYLH